MYQQNRLTYGWSGWQFILAAWVLLLCAGLAGSTASAHTPGKPAPAQSITAGATCPVTGSIIDSPTVAASDSYLHGIAIHAPNDIWAVGDSSNGDRGLTLTMHWDGSSWSIVPSPSPGTLINALSDVAVISADDAWAVGFYGNDGANIRTLILHWDGSDWTFVERSPNPGANYNTLYDIVALSADDVWTVGRYRTSEGLDKTLTLHWDGNSWTHVPSPNVEPRDNLLFGVSAVSSNDIWAAGYYWDSNGPYDTRTLTMHWDGSSWSIVSSPNAGFGYNSLYAITAVSANDAWAVGNGSQGTLTMHWDGSSWTVVPSNSNGILMGVGAVSADEVWAVGYQVTGVATERTLMLRWDGAQWSEFDSLNAGPSRNFLRDIAIVPDGTFWAVGEYDYADPPTVRRHTMAQRYVGLRPFSDVPPGSAFYPYVRCLTCMGIISGYDDGTFRPNNNVTRGQLSKIVSNSAGFIEEPGPQIFEDVPPGSTFYEWVQRLASRGHIGGYPCGGVGEPCISGRPYFRPNNNATRAQISKIVSNARGYNEPSGTQIFEDVPPSHGLYEWIQRLAQHGAMGGYECGGAGEPCGAQRRPYFRPNNNATRGQTSKIVSNTFFPQCTP